MTTPKITREQAQLLSITVAEIVRHGGGRGDELAQLARETLLREFEEINRRTSRLPAVWPFRR